MMKCVVPLEAKQWQYWKCWRCHATTIEFQKSVEDLRTSKPSIDNGSIKRGLKEEENPRLKGASVVLISKDSIRELMCIWRSLMTCLKPSPQDLMLVAFFFVFCCFFYFSYDLRPLFIGLFTAHLVKCQCYDFSLQARQARFKIQ